MLLSLLLLLSGLDSIHGRILWDRPEKPRLNLEFNIDALIPENYNNKVRPINPWGTPENTATNVTVYVYLNELKNVDDAQQHLDLDLIILQEWYDDRLNLDLIDEQVVVSRGSDIQKFWLPDTYIINALHAQIVDAFEPAQKLIITERGLMHYAIRVDARIRCSLNLQLYPMDYQYCDIRMSTILYNTEELRFDFKLFDIHKDRYPEFKIRLWWQYQTCRPWHNPIRSNSCIVATVKLVRRLSYYIIRYYLLTFLYVVITFVGFWIPINGWPARVTCMLIPLMNLITFDIDVNNDIKVNYVTAFHWWMMWIQGFVFLDIVEYAAAIAWAHFIMDKKAHRKLLEEARQGIVTVEVPPVLLGYYTGNNGWYAEAARFVDRMLFFFFGEVDLQREPYVRNKIDYSSRVLFPLVFLLFVTIYILATVAPWAANFN